LLVGGPAASAEPFDGVKINRPREVLFVRERRLAELAAAPKEIQQQLCGAKVRRWRTHDPLTRVISPDDYGADGRSEPFAHTVMRSAAAAWGTQDAKARKALVDLLDRWAKGQGLTQFDRDEESNYYAVERTLLPVLIGWSLVRDLRGVPEKDSRRIEKWLERVMKKRLRPGDPLNRENPNNHIYLSASVEMAWAVMVGDDDRFRKAVTVYPRAMAQMREDGSFPRETERGSRALWYQRHAISSLVAMAEIAAVQGYDLYKVNTEGRDLHLAVRFLLDAIQNPKLVWKYAEANVNPGPSRNWMVQDMGFLRRRGHGRHYMAWAEAYMRRFPDRPEAIELARVLRERDPNFRPMVDEYSGGDTTCFFARPEQLANAG
jgi:poly(beta-D-mannuronate) lyase